jgi:SAM-dependent methyltransferase
MLQTTPPCSPEVIRESRRQRWEPKGMSAVQETIDRANSLFWNELCGTNLATSLGIADDSPASLAKFDTWYFNLYPYLLPIIRPDRMRGRRVLEIGLGYGSLGQKLAALGADYTGMDIAAKPVDHMNWRLHAAGLPGRALRGSALAMPFPDGSFDFLVSIGCFHHTGDVQRCFDETYRVLAPRGTALMMVYNKYSFREWCRRPWATLREVCRGVGRPTALDTNARAQYDANHKGDAAPETVLLSVRDLRKMLDTFETVRCQKRNADNLFYKGKLMVARDKLLGNVGRVLGLDIYIEATKPAAAPALCAAA